MLTYAKIEKSDNAEIIELYKKYINYGDGIVENLNLVLNNDTTFGCKCCDGEKIVGLIIAEKGIAFTGGRMDFTENIIRDSCSKDVFTGTAFIVLEEYRKQGIASKLTCFLLDEMRLKKIEYFALDMWVYPNGITPALLVTRQAKKCYDYGEVKNFYADNYKQNIFCPVCGEKCRCSARIMLLQI